MNLRRAACFTLLLSAPAFAGAPGFHKCVDAQGHAKYSQSPCHDDARPPAKPAAPVPEPATPARTEKLSPETHAHAAPATAGQPAADQPLTDSMGRPDVTRITQQKQP